MKILGISAFYHDSAAAIVHEGKILAAAQEERFTRKKHDSAFPEHAVRFCLKYSGFSLDELDAVVFYDKPLLKFERLLETYYGFAPKGVTSFLKSIPVWVKEKLLLKDQIHKNLKNIGTYDKKDWPLLFPEHHLSHAASAFYPSPFEEAAILTLDGVGEWATASICSGKGREITIHKELRFPHSIGLLYSAITYFLGFRVNSGEYKLMGLAPYGRPNHPDVARFLKLIKEHLAEIREDGSLWLNQKYFKYATGLRMVPDKMWANLFGFPRREAEKELTQQHCDLALAIQQFTEEAVIAMAREAQKITGSTNLCLAGGVALNCVANGKLQNEEIFSKMFIQPAAGDAGGALGAALAAHHLHFEAERTVISHPDAMQGAFLGPKFSALETELMSRKYKAPFTHFEQFESLADQVAKVIAEGNVVGWFQDRMEFGPRALGNRSILGDPRNPEMQKKLNLKIKFRESFRPFAPAVLAELAEDYFGMRSDSPYMLLVRPVKKTIRKPVPEGYADLPLKEKLYTLRSELPAITHIDFSARIQTVDRDRNEKFWKLLQAFHSQTGSGVLVNTSFNVRGEPIVRTPEEAYQCFMRTEMDYLVIGNFLFSKQDQPEWAEKTDWREDYVLD